MPAGVFLRRDAARAAHIVRAGVEIVMPIGSKTCTVNGEPFTMDIAPYIENGRTMIPARYVSELFGQSVEWLEEDRVVAVTENRALAGDTNLEAWAMAMGAYMFPYTRELGKKWGERGILCWDLFRMSNLVQWGYAAGYLSYPETLALLEPAVALLQENFRDWDEAFENYLDGYNRWARNDVAGKDPWTVTRGPYVKKLMQDYSELFDNSLFKTPIKSVPGLTAADLLACVQ